MGLGTMKVWGFLFVAALAGGAFAEDNEPRGFWSWLFPPLDPLPEDLENAKPSKPLYPPGPYKPGPYGKYKPYLPDYKPEPYGKPYKPRPYGEGYKPSYGSPLGKPELSGKIPSLFGGPPGSMKPNLGKPSLPFKTPLDAASKRENIAAGISGLLAMGKGHLRPLNIVLNIPATPAVSAGKSAELAKAAEFDPSAIKTSLETLIGLLDKGGKIQQAFPGISMIGTKDPMQLNVNAQQPLFPLPSLASMPMMQGYPSPTYENPQPSYYRPTTTTMRPTTYSSYYTTTTTPPSTTAYPSKKPLMPLMPLMPLNLIPISSFRPDMESLVFNEEDFRNAAEEDLSGVSYD